MSTQQNRPKKQHFLPVVYLKQFSPDERAATRTSRIFRCDGRKVNEVSVESQCYESLFYSKKRASEAENTFKEMEGMYGTLLKRVWNSEQPQNAAEYFGMIVFMFDLHLRNAAYFNHTGEERIDAYEFCVRSLRDHILCLQENASDNAVVEHLKERWVIRLIQSDGQQALMTSDNPCLWCSGFKHPGFSFMLLPLTPRHLAVAFDKKFHSVSGKFLKGSDLDALNGGLISRCLKAVYSHKSFNSLEMENVGEILKVRQFQRGSIDLKNWKLSVTTPKGLSFIKDI
jgi:hypothetical protein